MCVSVLCYFEPMTMSRETHIASNDEMPYPCDEGNSELVAAVTHLLMQVRDNVTGRHRRVLLRISKQHFQGLINDLVKCCFFIF